jgi:hypothetical protein
MELFEYYNLTESANADLVLAKLELLSQDYKIEYQYFPQREVIKVEDLDLSDTELEKLIETFENNDIIPDYDFSENSGYDDLDMGSDWDY